jgi:chemotaxis protein MotB
VARKHKHPEHVNHERWLVSYADFITLLFATFTALYALSKSDADKSKAMAESMRISFGAPANTLIPMASIDFKAVPSDKPGASPAGKGKAKVKKQATQEDLENTKGALESILMTRKLLDAVQLEITDRGLVISLREAGFFESGKSEMKWSAYPILGEIAQSLSEYRNPVRVEGHTDTIPIRTRTFPSNWELSSGRATEVVRILSSRFGMEPTRLSAVSYAEFRPAFSNATAAGRSRNRRVDLVVVNADAERSEAPAMPQESIPSHLETPDETSHSAAGPTASDANGANPHQTPIHGDDKYHPALEDWTGSQ